MIKKLITLLLTGIMVSCASTNVIDSWKEDDLARTYNHLMIIGVSDSQQTRQIFEKHFVASLKENNIVATPSYKLINSKQEVNRETVVRAIDGTDIDAVLVTYLVSADVEIKSRNSPLNVNYSEGIVNNKISATIISNRGQSKSEEVVVLKNDLYDKKSRSLVWSVQTKSTGPESIDQVVKDVTSLIIDELLSDQLIK